MSVEVLDLEQLVEDYAEEFLDKKQRKQADLENPVIVWDRMKVLYGETNYTQQGDSRTPTFHALFSANFVNKTPKTQTYALRTERRTRSSCSISFTKTYTYGGGIQVKLTPPKSFIEANAGFQASLTNEKSVCQSFEQELAWSVNNEIEVPPGCQTKAELVIKEDHFNGDFQILTTFEGKVLVTYESKKNRDHIQTINVSVNNLFNGNKDFVFDDLNRPTYTAKGVCKCKFGVEQNVKLTESAIALDDNGSQTV